MSDVSAVSAEELTAALPQGSCLCLFVFQDLSFSFLSLSFCLLSLISSFSPVHLGLVLQGGTKVLENEEDKQQKVGKERNETNRWYQ